MRQSCQCVVRNSSGGKSYEEKKKPRKGGTLIKLPIFVTENLLNVEDSEIREVMDR